MTFQYSWPQPRQGVAAPAGACMRKLLFTAEQQQQKTENAVSFVRNESALSSAIQLYNNTQ